MRIARSALVAVAIIALAGCASPSENGSGDEEAPVSEMSGEWQLTKGADANGSWVVNGIPVTLVIAEDTVSGQAPCNSYTGESSVNGSGITIGTIASTLKACEDTRRTDLETRYLAALEKVTTAKVSDATPKTLTLTGPDETLRFTIVDKKTAN